MAVERRRSRTSAPYCEAPRMAPVGPMLRPWKPRPTGAVWRLGEMRQCAALTSLALAFALSAARSLHAQDSPGSLLVDSSSSAATTPAERPLPAPFAVNAPPLSFWSRLSELAPRFRRHRREQPSLWPLDSHLGGAPPLGRQFELVDRLEPLGEPTVAPRTADHHSDFGRDILDFIRRGSAHSAAGRGGARAESDRHAAGPGRF